MAGHKRHGRERRHEEHENHERWLVSYADFITLLFAFFVVMYSLSSVNEGKYRVLAEALEAAFRAPARSMDPIQVGAVARAPIELTAVPRKAPAIMELDLRPITVKSDSEPRMELQAKSGKKRPRDGQEMVEDTSNVESEALDARAQDKWEPNEGPKIPIEDAPREMIEVAARIERALAPLIADGIITVRRSRSWLQVEINTSILFDSGSSVLSGEAQPVIAELAEILSPIPNPVYVEGFTDNVPISTAIFPSNWELSAARSAAVVRLLGDSGVGPERMAAIGFGEHRPAADNDSPEGRSRNRRVILTVLAAANEDGASPDFATVVQALDDAH